MHVSSGKTLGARRQDQGAFLPHRSLGIPNRIPKVSCLFPAPASFLLQPSQARPLGGL